MRLYNITRYTRLKAKELGVTVKQSTVKGKKIDVFKNGKKVASIGQLGAGDFPTFLKKYGAKFAEKRQLLYKERHEKDRHKVGSPGWYADQLLW